MAVGADGARGVAVGDESAGESDEEDSPAVPVTVAVSF